MNIKLLRRIQKTILKHPKQFNMDYWFEYNKPKYPRCGTAACIAGWAYTLGETKKGQRANPLRAARIALPLFGKKGYLTSTAGPSSPIKFRAMELLDITEDQAERLFYTNNWPKRAPGFYNMSHEDQARLASDRIDQFIETNGTK